MELNRLREDRAVSQSQDNSGGNDRSGPSIDVSRLEMKLRMSLVSTRESINDAAERITRVAHEHGYDEADVTDLSIALREALANAIIHGNQSDPDKRVLLRCYCDEATGMLVTVRDEGPGFSPDSVPDPRGAERIHLHHGRGIFLMRELMDHVEHR